MPLLGSWLAELRGLGVAGLLFAIFWASVLSAGVLVLRWSALGRGDKAEPESRTQNREARQRSILPTSDS